MFSLGWLELNLSVQPSERDCPRGPEIVPNSPRLLAELHHSRAARIRMAGGGAGGETPQTHRLRPWGFPTVSPSHPSVFPHHGIQRITVEFSEKSQFPSQSIVRGLMSSSRRNSHSRAGRRRLRFPSPRRNSRGHALPHRPRRRPAPRLDAASYECHFLLNIAPAIGARLPPDPAGSRRSFSRERLASSARGPDLTPASGFAERTESARAEMSPRGICGANEAKWG